MTKSYFIRQCALSLPPIFVTGCRSLESTSWGSARNLVEVAMITQTFSRQDIESTNVALAAGTPEQILRWAVEVFHPRLTMATAFGAEGCCLIHMLAEIEPNVRIFNLETGYQFAETLELRERLKQRYGVEVEYVRPEMTVAEYEAEHGGPLHVH